MELLEGGVPDLDGVIEEAVEVEEAVKDLQERVVICDGLPIELVLGLMFLIHFYLKEEIWRLSLEAEDLGLLMDIQNLITRTVEQT